MEGRRKIYYYLCKSRLIRPALHNGIGDAYAHPKRLDRLLEIPVQVVDNNAINQVAKKPSDPKRRRLPPQFTKNLSRWSFDRLSCDDRRRRNFRRAVLLYAPPHALKF